MRFLLVCRFDFSLPIEKRKLLFLASLDDLNDWFDFKVTSNLNLNQLTNTPTRIKIVLAKLYKIVQTFVP